MSPALSKARVAAIAAFVTAAVFIPVSAASATAYTPVKLNGDWAPFNRCPVTSPAMLNASGVKNTPDCVASSSYSATIKIGHLAPVTSKSNLQFGLLSSSSGFAVISPSEGSEQSGTVTEPGGLSHLICPSTDPAIAKICKELSKSSTLNKLTATLESDGYASNFNLAAGLSSGIPIVTLPVKIHLQNSFLGQDCFIGTRANPIVLHPENATTPTVKAESFDANGTPDSTGVMTAIYSRGGTQQDTSFSVPAATGCGKGQMLNKPINRTAGLPSAAGKNSLVLTNASAYLAGLTNPSAAAPHAGVVLSNDWHSAIVKNDR
jgi:hypothetical protein